MVDMWVAMLLAICAGKGKSENGGNSQAMGGRSFQRITFKISKIKAAWPGSNKNTFYMLRQELL